MLANDTVHTSTLCDKIRTYWREHGFPSIKAWPETLTTTYNRNATSIVIIRSNLGPNGYPPQ
jgi:hypothetical protein